MKIFSNRNFSMWMARVLIALVLAANLQCALAFIWAPALYGASFGIDSPTSAAVIRGFGILFLMWNVPYAFALAHPVRHRISLIEAITMQGIGLVGESGMRLLDGATSMPAANAIERFMWFDGIGLVFLLAAFVVTRIQERTGRQPD